MKAHEILQARCEFSDWLTTRCAAKVAPAQHREWQDHFLAGKVIKLDHAKIAGVKIPRLRHFDSKTPSKK